jgi:hypothetical protein
VILSFCRKAVLPIEMDMGNDLDNEEDDENSPNLDGYIKKWTSSGMNCSAKQRQTLTMLR